MERDAVPRPVVPPAGAIRERFRQVSPNHPALSAVLNGHAPGRVVADDRASSRQAVLHSNYGFTFIGSAVEQAFLDDAVAQLARDAVVALIWTEREDARLDAPAAPHDVVARLEYRRREGAIDDLLASVPDGCTFRRMDAKLLDRCLWKGEIALACGSVEGFLSAGLGWCLMRDEAILSEAYAVFRGEDTYEIGVITSPEHRGQGYAPLACAKLIESCETRGMGTYWSCHEVNGASQRVAEELGFTDRRPYRFMVYRPAAKSSEPEGRP